LQKQWVKNIAEIVECPKTISLLREIGANYGQDYIFGESSEQSLERNIFQINDALQ